MQLDADLLYSYGAATRKIEKGEYVFKEGQLPRFFFLLLEGMVKMVSTSEDGKEMVQGIFTANQCFGEPPLILDRLYPASAVATQDTVVLRLQRDRFLQILTESQDVAQYIIQCLAARIYDKTITNQFLICQHPEDRILLLIKKMALNGQLMSDGMVPFTRQQLADFTGLRVETVIRAISKLHLEGKITMKDHRVYAVISR